MAFDAAVSKKKRPSPTTAEINVHIGQRIRLARRKAGKHQLHLAVAVGTGHRTVSKYESGAIQISAHTLWKIATALNQPIEYFYKGLRKPSPKKVR